MTLELLKSRIGSNIRARRTDKKLSLCQLANDIGINKGQLSKIENAKTTVQVDSLLKIANYFKISVSKLVP